MLIDPLSTLRQFSSPFNPYFINIKTKLREQIMAILYYLSSLEGELNVALFYDTDLAGCEAITNINEVVDSFKTFTNQGDQIRLPDNTTVSSSLKFILNFTSEDIMKKGVAGSVTSTTDVIDYLIVISTSYLGLVPSIIKQINLNQVSNTAVTETHPHCQIILCNTPYAINTSIAVHNAPGAGNIVLASGYYPLSGSSSSLKTYKTKVTLLEDYKNATGFQGDWSTFNEPGIAGYFTGLFIGAVVSQVNGDVNNSSFNSTIYQTGLFSVEGIKLGIFSYGNRTGCNSGASISSIALYEENGNITPVWNFTWPDCNAPLLYNTATHSDAPLSTTYTIITVVLVVLCACMCLVILLLFAILIIYRLFLRSRRRNHLKPPRFEDFAIKPIFTEKANLDLMLITCSPNTGPSAKREMLSNLESFLLQPSRAYSILQGLTKAGLARDEISCALIYIYFCSDDQQALLNYGIQKEIVQASQESTLFREDSALAALWGSFVRLTGGPYLWHILSQTLHNIAQASGHDKHSDEERFSVSDMLVPKSFEVDKNKLQVKDEYFVNILHLKLAAQSTFNKVSSAPFPPELKCFLANIREKTNAKYPELTYGVIANFVFLRFICSAITQPNGYGLWKRQPNQETTRFLVLLSKTLQNLGFGVEFEKEGYMKEMNDFIVSNRESMNEWFQTISDENSDPGMLTNRFPQLAVKITPNPVIKDNCLKWMYCQISTHKSALNRELERKMDEETFKEYVKELEEIGVWKHGETSSGDSITVSASARSYSSSKSAGVNKDELDSAETTELLTDDDGEED